MIGILLGWGISAAAMRGALAARNEVILQSTLQKVQSRYTYRARYHFDMSTLFFLPPQRGWSSKS